MPIMYRLKVINNLISNANKVIDVGSDHAFLSLYLIKNNLANEVINIEINSNALKNGIENIKKNLVDSSKIINILGDGLKAINQKINVDYVIISGMGANNIINILNNNVNVNWKNLILEPNCHVHAIREWIKAKKYHINYETIIEDRKKFYEIIKISKTDGLNINNEIDSFFGPYNLKYPCETFKKYWNEQLKIFQKIVEKKDIKHINEQIKLIKQYVVYEN